MELKLSESKAKDGVEGWADGQLLDSSFGRHMGLTQSCFDQGFKAKNTIASFYHLKMLSLQSRKII